MPCLITTVPTLAISTIYCLWHFYWQVELTRRQRLCQRVSNMLWVMATRGTQYAAKE